MTARPTLPRLTTEQERRQIKVRTKQLVELAGGPEFLAPVTGVLKAQLSKYGTLSEADCFIRANVILELDRQIGAPMMLETLAAMLGYALVPLEPEPGDEVDHDDLAAVSREGGDVVQSLALGMADGRFDAEERRHARQEIAENIAVLHRVDRKLAAGA